MIHQGRANALSLVLIDHCEGHFGRSGPHHHITPAADNRRSSGLFDQRDQRDMVDEIYIHEERYFTFRKAALRYEEPTVESTGTRARYGRGQIRAIIRRERANLE